MKNIIMLVFLGLVGATIGWSSNYYQNDYALLIGYLLGLLVGILVFIPVIIANGKFLKKLDNVLKEMIEKSGEIATPFIDEKN